MDSLEIKAMIDAMAASDLQEMEFNRDGWTLRLVRGAQAGLLQAPAGLTTDAATHSDPTTEHLHVRAPLAGVVYLSAAPGQPAFAPVGAAVTAGATVCIIEAMKVFVEVKAERDGVIGAVLVATETDVDADQPLFRWA